MKLHLGCGSNILPGFVNIDFRGNVDLKLDIRDLSNFGNNTIDEIYASHVIEYFDRDEVIIVLNEWKRVLKSGGILRLAVPDFSKIIQVYNSSDLDSRGILGPLYGKIKTDTGFIYHKTVYDFKSLSKLLTNLGFNDIKIYDTEIFNFDDCSKAYIPHMDKNGILISLNIICKK